MAINEDSLKTLLNRVCGNNGGNGNDYVRSITVTGNLLRKIKSRVCDKLCRLIADSDN